MNYIARALRRLRVETLLFLLGCAGVFVSAFGPLLVLYVHAPVGAQYRFADGFFADYYHYLMKIKSGMMGQVGYYNRFTEALQPQTYGHAIFPLIGLVSKIFGLTRPDISYLISRVVTLGILFAVFYWVTIKLFKATYARIIATMLFFTGTSGYAVTHTGGMLRVVEPITFAGFYNALSKFPAPPQHLLASALLLFVGVFALRKKISVRMGTVIFVGAFLLTAISFVAKKKRPIETLPIVIGSLFLVSLFLTDPFSNPLYRIRIFQYALYPYRFLFVSTFIGSMFAGYLPKKSIVLHAVIMILAVYFGLPFTRPYLEIFPFPQSYFSKPQMLGYAVPTLKTMGSAEFLPKTANVPFLANEEHTYLTQGILPQKFILPKDEGTVAASHVNEESLSLTVVAHIPTSLTVSTLYYPNWRATIDGTPTQIRHDAVGRIILPITTGAHTVRLWFGYSVVEYIGMAASLCGIILFLYFLIG